MTTRARKNKPAAFLSYVRLNNAIDGGNIIKFAERLRDEFEMQTGESLEIFIDRDDIAWGQNWRERLDRAISSSTFFIPIITPSYFKRPECLRELRQFVNHERRLGRNDLILPVYYVRTDELEDAALRRTNALAQLLHARQRADWRELRFKPMTSPQIRKMLESLALNIKSAVAQPAPAGGAAKGSSGKKSPKKSVTKKSPTKKAAPTKAAAKRTAAKKAAKPGRRR